MKVAAKSASYLVRNPYSYCFRMIVPKDLQKIVGLKELRYSLKTDNLDVTKYKALLLAGQVRSIFQQLRKGRKVLRKLSDDQIQELIHQFIQDTS
jgi:hypothetical protein